MLKIENGTREVVLAETAPSYYEALQALHIKSAEAVQNYINSNGFDLVPSIKKQKPKANRYDDSHESDSSTVTLDDCESLSDNETVSVTSVGRTKRNRRKADRTAKTNPTRHKARQGRTRSRSPSFSTTRARSRSTCSSSSDYELHYDPPVLPTSRPPWLDTFRQRMPPRPPQNAFSTFPTGAPPPPPPPPSGHQGHPPRRFAPGLAMPPPPPPAPFSFTNKLPPNPPMPPTVLNIPPTSPQTNNNNNNPTPYHNQNQNHHPNSNNSNNNSTPHPQPTHDVILHIRWRHHGERHILEQIPTNTTNTTNTTTTATKPGTTNNNSTNTNSTTTPPTSSLTTPAIQQAALSFIRRQPASFNSYQPQAAPPRWQLAGLRAQVKAVVVDGVVYDLGRWAGEDLGRVVDGVRRATAASAAAAVTGTAGGGDCGMEGMLRFEVEVWNEGLGPLGVAALAAGVRPGMGPGSGSPGGGGGGGGSGGGGSPHGVGSFGPGQRMAFPPSPGVVGAE